MGLSFKQKIIATVVLAAVLPALLVSGIAVYESYVSSRALVERSLNGLTEAVMRQEVGYFNTVDTLIQTQARSETVRTALKEFTAAAHGFDAGSAAVDEEVLRGRYVLHQKKTSGTTPDQVDKWMPADPKARALQYLYIANNSNALGEKQKLNSAGDGSEYSRVHAKFHPGFRDFVTQYKMYDFFLVDAASGDVVYSDFKEIDFMSNVKQGPFADSHLSKVVRKALESKDPQSAFFSDMEAYLPSYSEHAMFVAMPITEGGETIGALAFQLSAENMRQAFLPLQKLGATADGFLVDGDGTYVTQPLVEKAKIGDAAAVSIGEIAKGILAGTMSEGVHYYAGDDGYPMTSVFRKMEVFGHAWVMSVGQDDEEMFAALHEQVKIMLVAASAVILAVVGLGLALASGLVKPLQAMAINFAIGSEKVGRATSQVSEAVASMVAASEETSTQSKVVRRNSGEASGYVSSVSTAVEELNTSIHDISQSIGETNHLIEDAVNKATETDRVVRSLGDASKRITEVVGLINDLAEQTNLLALNAAIEAARAGDAGRGFAVVADEVKKLASNTSKATVDIKEQVDGILAVSEQSVKALQTVVDAIHKIRDNATNVSAAVEEQSGVARQISSSVRDAAHRVQQVDENMNGIEQAASDTGVAADQVNGSAQDVQSAFDEMRSQMMRVLEKMGIKV